MINKAIIMGRITRDIELKTSRGGKEYVKFSVACDNGYGDNKYTDFVPVIAWGKTAEFISKYFAKGKMIIISGRITTASWTGEDGKTKYDVGVVAEEVKFGETKKENTGKKDSFEELDPNEVNFPWES